MKKIHIFMFLAALCSYTAATRCLEVTDIPIIVDKTVQFAESLIVAEGVGKDLRFAMACSKYKGATFPAKCATQLGCSSKLACRAKVIELLNQMLAPLKLMLSSDGLIAAIEPAAKNDLAPVSKGLNDASNILNSTAQMFKTLPAPAAQ